MIRSAILVSVVTICLGGCALTTPTPDPQDVVPHHEAAVRRPMRRVAVMIDQAPPRHEETAERFADALRRQLTERNLFEPLPVTSADLADANLASIRTRGRYAPEDLLTVGRRFGVEGVLYVTMTDFAATPTIRFGARLALIDCRDGSAAWSTDVMLDGEDRVVAKDVHNWHDVHLKDRGSLIDHELVLISPRLFFDYAATRIVGTME